MDIHSTKNKKARRINSKVISSLVFLSLTSLTAFAQEKAVSAEPDSVFYNPLMIALLSIASLLFIVIAIFGNMVSAAAAFKAEKDKEENIRSSNTIKTIIILLLASSISNSLFAQTTVPALAGSGSNYWGLDSMTFFTMITIIAVEIFIIWFFYDISMQLMGVKERKQREAEEKEKETANAPSFLEKLNASVAIEQEANIMLDHNYDGIRELDNNLPPWWKYGFYCTIIFAFIYLIHFQVLHTGQSPKEEYDEQIAKGKADVEEYRKKAANLVDEKNVTLLTDKESLESGRNIFIENCAPCHGKSGEGNVGPNLTDDYWLHKGGIKDIFRTIKFGWPEKGMKSWEQDLGAKQIHEVASYIKSLGGSNPANAKEKQGELYLEAGINDSTKTLGKDSLKATDSTQVASKK
jgi:cytochrome c oxidase cbb3-type subunit 3